MWVLVIDRTVDPFDPRTPVIVGTYRSQERAEIRAEQLRRRIERAGLEYIDVFVEPVFSQSEPLDDLVDLAR